MTRTTAALRVGTLAVLTVILIVLLTRLPVPHPFTPDATLKPIPTYSIPPSFSYP